MSETITYDAALADVEEFEFFTQTFGFSIEATLAKLDMSGRTILRRYQQIGRPVPAGLYGASNRPKPVAA